MTRTHTNKPLGPTFQIKGVRTCPQPAAPTTVILYVVGHGVGECNDWFCPHFPHIYRKIDLPILSFHRPINTGQTSNIIQGQQLTISTHQTLSFHILRHEDMRRDYYTLLWWRVWKVLQGYFRYYGSKDLHRSRNVLLLATEIPINQHFIETEKTIAPKV